MAKAKTPRQTHKEASDKLATLTLTAEAKVMEERIALLESPKPVWMESQNLVPLTDFPGYDHWGMYGVGAPYLWTNPDDRSEGRYRPYYENAHDVRRMRAEGRSVYASSVVANSALHKLSDYVIGNGFDFIAQPRRRFRDDPTAKQLADIVQQAIDKLLDYNNFVGALDRELHEHSRIDGDTFVGLYPEGDCVRFEAIDPGCIVQPADPKPLERWAGTSHKLNGWWHGVHTVFQPHLKHDDTAKPLGYHAVFDNLGDFWDYLPASRVEHIKRNVDLHARVGVSDFAIMMQDLENEAKLRRNTAVGAAINAAIAGIRQHAEGTTQSTVESMVRGSATATYERPIQGGTRNTAVQNIAPGTIKDIPKGMEWLAGPMGTLAQPVYVEVDAHLLRIIGTRWSMPEFLVAGDASNSNYASTLVAESPFVKYCEHSQQFYAQRFERLLWKALGLIQKTIAGNWRQICQTVEINAEYASPASRDKLQQAQCNQILVDAGIMSKRTWANDSGLDYDEELQNQATEPKPAPKVVQAPFGGPQQKSFFGEDANYGKPQPKPKPKPKPVKKRKPVDESPRRVSAIDWLLERAGN